MVFVKFSSKTFLASLTLLANSDGSRSLREITKRAPFTPRRRTFSRVSRVTSPAGTPGRFLNAFISVLFTCIFLRSYNTTLSLISCSTFSLPAILKSRSILYSLDLSTNYAVVYEDAAAGNNDDVLVVFNDENCEDEVTDENHYTALIIHCRTC